MIYKPTFSKPLPKGAIKSTPRAGQLKGVRLAKFTDKHGTRTERLTKNGKKILIETEHWHICFEDKNKIRRKLEGYTDKEATKRLDELIQDLVNGKILEVKILETIPLHIRDMLASWGLLKARDMEAAKPLLKHLEDWKQTIIDTGRSTRYANQRFNQVKEVFSCFTLFSEIQASKLQNEIAKLKKTVKAKNEESKLYDKIIGEASQTTKNYYLKSCRSFCAWMIKDGRTATNPLLHLSPGKSQKQTRTAFEPDELRQLRAYTETAGISFGLTGHERAMLYVFATETGFRASEIKALKVSDFYFEKEKSEVVLSGQYTKNSKDAGIEMKDSTAEKLKSFFANKLPQAAAFRLPYITNMARMLRKDIKDAGIEIEASRGDLLDFHCLRHTYITYFALTGVHPSVAQKLARHSDINLTMSRYTHVLRGQERAAINALPDLWKSPENQQKNQTGTDGKNVA